MPTATTQARKLSPAATLPSRWRMLAYGGMLVLTLALLVPFRVGTDDSWVQIRTGQYILEHGIPHTDPFSYTTPGREFVEHEWAVCVLFALLYTHMDWAGLVLYKVVVVGLTWWLAVRIAQTLGAQLPVVAAVFPVMGSENDSCKFSVGTSMLLIGT
jgi:hypothetical protein